MRQRVAAKNQTVASGESIFIRDAGGEVSRVKWATDGGQDLNRHGTLGLFTERGGVSRKGIERSVQVIGRAATAHVKRHL